MPYPLVNESFQKMELLLKSGQLFVEAFNSLPTLGLLMGKMESTVMRDIPGLKGVTLGGYKFASQAEFETADKIQWPMYLSIAPGQMVTRMSGEGQPAVQNFVETVQMIETTTSLYSHRIDIPQSILLELVKNKSKFAMSSIESRVKAALRAYYRELGLGLVAVRPGFSGAPQDGIMGSLAYMISDGRTVAQRGGTGTDESAFAFIYGRDRVQAPGLQSKYVAPAAPGPLTDALIADAAGQARDAGATDLWMPLNNAEYFALRANIIGTGARVDITEEQEQFSPQTSLTYFKVSEGVKVYRDANVPRGRTRAFIFDRDAVKFQIGMFTQDARGMSLSLPVRNPNTVASYISHLDTKQQCILEDAQRCAVIANLTAA